MFKSNIRADRNGETPRRILLFDTLRGLTIVSMVLFHAVYDLTMLYGIQIHWFFDPTIQNIWRDSISWTFLLIAGVMCSFSHSNAKRSLRYLALSFLIWIATTIAAVDTPINFGIIFCMGASTALYAIAHRWLEKNPTSWGLIIFTFLFLLTLPIPNKSYSLSHLAWLGFPDASFASGDYYPVIPYSHLFLAGSYLGVIIDRVQSDKRLTALFRFDIPVLRTIGQHPLSIYIAHQPLLILLFDALSAIC